MHNLPIQLLLAISIFAYLRYSRVLPTLALTFRRALLPMDDYWTWTTSSGAEFEDVEVEQIESGQVVFQHKFGIARLPISLLSEGSRVKLYRGYKPADLSAIHGTESGPSELAKFDARAGQPKKNAEHRHMLAKRFQAAA